MPGNLKTIILFVMKSEEKYGLRTFKREKKIVGNKIKPKAILVFNPKDMGDSPKARENIFINSKLMKTKAMITIPMT
jgi:hypothetical protein